MDIQKLVAAEEELLISLRRHFHEHPELSEQEFRTLEYIDERLDAWGIPNVEIPFGGIFATIDSGKPGRTILLRADIDALPIEESPTNLAGPKICVSQNPGVSHACGHDAHTAMLLVAAKILAEHKDEWCGKVICMFEQAEEMGDRGIRDLLPYLETNGIHIDACYGTHMMYSLPAGKVAVLPGAALAGAMFFCVKINGKSGHGSMPHLAKNPIDAFTTFDGELASYRMRSVAPNHMLTYSFGMVRAGDTPNVIPETLTFSGTARFFDDEDGLTFRKEFRRILAYVTEMQGMTAEILLDHYFPVTVNNEECAEAARTAIAAAKPKAYLAIWPRISPSLPARPQAAQPMAMFCGLIILPAEVPRELAATSHIGSSPRVSAAWSWTFPKRTSLEVPEPVTKVPRAPSSGATSG